MSAPRLIYQETVTASGNSAIIDARDIDSVNGYRAAIVFSSMGGTTPSFTTIIQETADETNFETAGSFAAATTDGYETIAVSGPRFSKLRINHTVSGTSPTAVVSIYVE